jgi:hypothetical protein
VLQHVLELHHELEFLSSAATRLAQAAKSLRGLGWKGRVMARQAQASGS